MYASVWVKADGRFWATRHGIDSRTMDNEAQQKKREGYRLVSLGGFSAGHGKDAVPAFCPIWEKREAGPVITSLVAEHPGRPAPGGGGLLRPGRRESVRRAGGADGRARGAGWPRPSICCVSPCAWTAFPPGPTSWIPVRSPT
ncbi:hypothetical protein [Nonomuraea roseola]|uniref:Uncharacterized protein n=1 Tax=Nonomuraea roseola TaxID=46179 RepID=A0ABV5PS86_9ACTN